MSRSIERLIKQEKQFKQNGIPIFYSIDSLIDMAEKADNLRAAKYLKRFKKRTELLNRS